MDERGKKYYLQYSELLNPLEQLGIRPGYLYKRSLLLTSRGIGVAMLNTIKMDINFIEGGRLISFDFDDTLSEPLVQKMAKLFIDLGNEIHITTSRCSGENRDLYKVAKRLGIPETRIHYTEGAYKSETLKMIGADMHFDDMLDELDQINSETKCLGFYPDMDLLKAMFS